MESLINNKDREKCEWSYDIFYWEIEINVRFEIKSLKNKREFE